MILDRRSAGLLRSVERTRQFTEALREDAGVAEVLTIVAHELDRPVWLLTNAAAFSPVGREPPTDADIAAAAETLGAHGSTVEFELADGTQATAFPLPRRHARAHLVCVAPHASLQPDDRLAIEQAIDFLSLQRDSARKLRTARRATADEFMRRATGGQASGEELEAWGRGLQVEARGHVVCVVVHAPRATPDDVVDIAAGLEDMADAHGVRRVVVTGDQEASAFLFPGRLDDAIDRAITRAELALRPELRRMGGAMGTSSVMAQDAADVLRTLHDARRVCQLNLLREPEPPADPEGPQPPLTTLLLMANEEARAALHQALLEPLVADDEEHGSELVRTLDVFLSTTGQWSASAAQLGVHVNTLRYRLSRIEKCTGRDLGSMADRVDFYVALRAGDPRMDRRNRRGPLDGVAQPQ
jgi:sugar diacid utilization regulator